MVFSLPSAALGLLALAAIPALIGLYFLRRRQPPRTVSALFLWKSPDRRAESGPHLQRFSRELSLLCEIGAALAAAAYLADLRLGSPVRAPHTVVVLDSRLSMAARAPGARSAAQRALERLIALARADGGRVSVIESGPRPRLTLGPAADPARLAGLAFAPRAGEHSLEGALALAHDLAGPRARVRLLTDRLPAPALEGVEVIALGEPLENDALVAASRRDEAGVATVDLRLAHFGAARAEVLVRLTTLEGTLLEEQRVWLGPGEERGVRARLETRVPLQVVLPDDALPEDGQATLLPSPQRRVTVGLHLGGVAGRAVRRAVEADAAASIGEPGDLAFEPAGKGAHGPWTAVVGVEGAARARLGPFFAERSEPLLAQVPFDGVLWACGDNPPGRPLLTAGPSTLISEEAGAVFHLNLELARSNVQRTPAFPLLIASLLSARRDALPGFARRHFGLDEEVRVATGDGSGWALEGPGGRSPLPAQAQLRLPPSAPGRLALWRGGERIDEAAVDALDAAVSDLRGRQSGEIDSPLPLGTTGPVTERSPWPLFALVALLCLDWIATGARSAPSEARSP
jgi:hypothetical protein